MRSLFCAYNLAFRQIFPKAQLRHPALYDLLQYYVLPDKFVAAGSAHIATILRHHCRTAFSREEAERLVALCRQTVTRPIGREVVRRRDPRLTQDILSAQQHKQ